MLIAGLIKDSKAGWIFVGVILASCVLVPVLNLLVPEGSPLHLSTYTVTLVGKYLTGCHTEKLFAYHE